ncbi:MAG TPA: hypothetical protein VHA11_11075 [Bryobacteraceae bacterium]|nr:hypothetical protein [Bryobacteraceae bacterium]
MALLATDSEVLWLNVMNGALGVVVLICCLVVLGAIVYQFTSVRRERERNVKAADREVRELLGVRDPHAFDAPGLGLTMADGGEPIDGGASGGDKKGK